MRRVVVTGLGLVTPLGSGVNQVWDRLITGKSGLRSIQSLDVSDLPAKIAGQVPLGDKSAGLFNADAFLEPKVQRKLVGFNGFGMAAAPQAIQDAGCTRQSPADRWPKTGRASGRE